MHSGRKITKKRRDREQTNEKTTIFARKETQLIDNIMSKAKREMKRKVREAREKEQGKRVVMGIAIAAVVLVILMMAFYSMW